MLTLLGDPCQTAVTIDMFPSTGNVCATIRQIRRQWDGFLDKALASKMLPAECVEKMALLYRDRRSQRLRSIASELVTTLSPICLPGKPEFWQTLIKGRPVWSALEPREYQTRSNAYLDERLPEIIQFDLLSLFRLR